MFSVEASQRNASPSHDIRSALPKEDQDDLKWFFGPGQSAFERSTFGPQLAHAELFSFGTKPCPKCEGEPTTEQSLRKAIDDVERYQREHAVAIAEGRMPRVPKGWESGGQNDGWCELCGGCGWVPKSSRHRRGGAITARPRGFEMRGAPAEPNSDSLERYGWASCGLRRIEPANGRVLEAFFGTGSDWENDKQRGRIFGVFPLTPAGKTLLKRAKKRSENEQMVPNDVALDNEWDNEGLQRRPGRAELFQAAREQAEAALRAAEREWLDLELKPRKRAAKAKAEKPETKSRVREVVPSWRLERLRRIVIEIESKAPPGDVPRKAYWDARMGL